MDEKTTVIKNGALMEYCAVCGGNDSLYQINDESKVVVDGDFKGRHFVILAHYMGHPNAYIEVKDTDEIYKRDQKEYLDFLQTVHGGSTYYGKAYWDANDLRTYVGWDYNHCDDYTALFFGCGTKYTVMDILMEVACAWTELECMKPFERKG